MIPLADICFDIVAWLGCF